MITENILLSIKKLLGITPEYTVFDPDVMMHINSAFFTLNQLGVGPKVGFKITDGTESWDQFLQDETKFEAVKSYVYLRVKMLFDPPLNASVVESIERQIKEFEWRLNVQTEDQNVAV